MTPAATVRSRRPDDLPALADLLGRQRPGSGYPYRWPLPMPVEEFVARPGQVAAWVAERDAEVLGHVALARLVPDERGRAWQRLLGRETTGLVNLSALFVDPEAQGAGLGRLLHDTAVAHALALGRQPVLDVLQGPGPAVDVYRHLGWREVGTLRPEWLAESDEPMLLMVGKELGPP